AQCRTANPGGWAAASSPVDARVPCAPSSRAPAPSRASDDVVPCGPFVTFPANWDRCRLQARRSAAADDLTRLEHLLNHLYLAAHEQDVGHLELLGVRAARLDDEVAGPDAQKPVAEQVAAPLLHDGAQDVVGRLAAADVLVHPELPRREDHVRL